MKNNLHYFYFISFILLLLSYVFYYIPKVEKLTDQIYFEQSLKMKTLLHEEINKKKDRVKTIAYVISTDKNIIQALISKDNSIISYYKDTIKKLQTTSEYKNIGLQILDKDGRSFYRSWSDNIGDDVAKIRSDVVQMIKTPQVMHTISVGRFDLSIRTMFPIFYNDEFIGSMELISKINSISDALRNREVDLLAVVHEDYSKEFIQPYSNLFIGQNYIANKNASKELIQKVEKNGLKKFLYIKDFILFDKFLVTTDEIKSMNGKEMSFLILFYKLNNINIEAIHIFQTNYTIFILIYIFICSLVLFFLLNKNHTKKLNLEITNQTLKIKEQQEELESTLKIYDKYVIFSRTDLKGVFTYVSSAFCKISGFKKEELIGKPQRVIMHPDMSKGFFKNLWKKLYKRHYITTKVKNMKKDGSFYWVDADIGPEFDKGGKHIGYFSVKEDITASVELEDLQKEIIFIMSSLAESRSKETSDHIERVSRYSEIIARGFGLDKKEIEILKLASQMHDIGKISILDSILNKPAKLTIKEFNIIKTHTTEGYKILNVSQRPLLKMAATIALTHHEKYDGTGYPKGLKGENIPLCGRIVALADVFDALANDRCYKKAWELDDIVDYIKEKKGKQFDPKLVEIFFNNFDKILQIKDSFSS